MPKIIKQIEKQITTKVDIELYTKGTVLKITDSNEPVCLRFNSGDILVIVNHFNEHAAEGMVFCSKQKRFRCNCSINLSNYMLEEVSICELGNLLSETPER